MTNLCGKWQCFSWAQKEAGGFEAVLWQLGGRGWWIRRIWETTASLRSQWENFAGEAAFPGTITYCLFATQCSSRPTDTAREKQAYIANARPPRGGNKARASYPRAPGFRSHSQMLLKKQCPSSEQELWRAGPEASSPGYITLYMPWVVVVPHQGWKGEEKVGGLRSFM